MTNPAAPGPVTEADVVIFELLISEMYANHMRYAAFLPWDEDAAYAFAAKALVDRHGMGAELVCRISDTAFDRAHPVPAGEFTPQS